MFTNVGIVVVVKLKVHNNDDPILVAIVVFTETLSMDGLQSATCVVFFSKNNTSTYLNLNIMKETTIAIT